MRTPINVSTPVQSKLSCITRIRWELFPHCSSSKNFETFGTKKTKTWVTKCNRYDYGFHIW